MSGQKNDPGKPGPSVGRFACRLNSALAEVFRRSAYWGSEAEIGEVAIADGNAGARHQQAIDGAHQASE